MYIRIILITLILLMVGNLASAASSYQDICKSNRALCDARVFFAVKALAKYENVMAQFPECRKLFLEGLPKNNTELKKFSQEEVIHYLALDMKQFPDDMDIDEYYIFTILNEHCPLSENEK